MESLTIGTEMATGPADDVFGMAVCSPRRAHGMGSESQLDHSAERDQTAIHGNKKGVKLTRADKLIMITKTALGVIAAIAEFDQASGVSLVIGLTVLVLDLLESHDARSVREIVGEILPGRSKWA